MLAGRAGIRRRLSPLTNTTNIPASSTATTTGSSSASSQVASDHQGVILAVQANGDTGPAAVGGGGGGGGGGKYPIYQNVRLPARGFPNYCNVGAATLPPAKRPKTMSGTTTTAQPAGTPAFRQSQRIHSHISNYSQSYKKCYLKNLVITLLYRKFFIHYRREQRFYFFFLCVEFVS